MSRTITQWWLTTTDNPYDPFDAFWDWWRFDELEKKYCTTGLMARFASCPDDAPAAMIQESNERAIEIIMTTIPLLSDEAQYKPVCRQVETDE